MIKNLLTLSVITLTFILSNTAHAGFGVSPGQIIENRLAPGSQFETTVYLVQGAPDIDLKVESTIDSKEMSDWITLDRGSEFIIPAGTQQFPFKVKIDVPEDAELGVYKGFIRVNVVPEEGNSDGNVQIAIGGRIDVSLTIGDDVIEEYDIKSIDILDIYEHEDPKVEVKINNTGNVSASPSSASFELFNKFGTIRLGYSESSDFEKVKSFSESKQIIDFPIDISFAPGEYWANVLIYDDNNKVIAEQRTVFDVSKSTFFEKNKDNLVRGGIILVILVLVWLVIRKFKRKK